MKAIKDMLMLATILGLMAGSFWLGREYDSFSPSPPLNGPVADTSPVEAPAQYIIMDTSGYDAGACCCGKWADGLTASGVPAVGRICAAPPEYPFGTVLDVEGMGEYVVRDRGGAIKGNKLDLLFESHQAAKEFGRKDLKVRVLR